MKYTKTVGALLLALSTTSIAQTPLQGPAFTHRTQNNIDVVGEVLTNTGAPYKGTPCVQLKVLPDVRYSGGRVWVCDSRVRDLKIGERLHMIGQATDTRLTKMGPHRRVIPLVSSPTQLKSIK